eukprot:727587_1
MTSPSQSTDTRPFIVEVSNFDNENESGEVASLSPSVIIDRDVVLELQEISERPAMHGNSPKEEQFLQIRSDRGSLQAKDFEIPWDLQNYATPTCNSTRMTIGQLLYGRRSPAEQVRPVEAQVSKLFVLNENSGFDESESESEE